MAYDDAPPARPSTGTRFGAYKRPTRRKNEAELARRYATSQLGLLSRAGLSDDQGNISMLAAQGAAGNDPAAAWRALSARMMAAHAAANPEGALADPRVWLRQQVANQASVQADQQAKMLAAFHGLEGEPTAPIAEAMQRRVMAKGPLMAAAARSAVNPLAGLRSVKRRQTRRPMRKSGLAE